MEDILDVLSIALYDSLKADIKKEGNFFIITFSDGQKYRVEVKKE